MKTNDLNFCGGLFKLLSKDWNVFTFNKRRKELEDLIKNR